jgi:hypothetical protein
MPTAARLAAAICFGLLGLAFAFVAMIHFEDARQPSYWFPLNGAVGLIVGWGVVGTRAGNGGGGGVGNGITGGVALLFWVFFLMAFSDMIDKSMRNAYDGPVEAVVGVFEIMGDYAVQFAYVDLGVLMIVGSIVSGLLAEFVAKRWS